MSITTKLLPVISIILFSFTLAACKDTEPTRNNILVENEPSEEDVLEENEPQPITYSFENPKTGQEFEIIHAYKLYEDFLKAVEDYPEDSPHQLYRQMISDPLYDACFNAEFNKFSVFEWTPEERVFNSIRKQVEAIDKNHINNLIKESLIKSSDILPSEKKTSVCVFPKDERFASDMMLNGLGKIIVFLLGSENDYYPRSFYYTSEFEDNSRWGISHEYHHSVWTEKHSTEKDYYTVLDSLIMEGQAVMFETLVYPEVNSTNFVVNESFDKELWSRLPNFESTSKNFSEILIGGSNGFPDYYGYSEGYKIIRAYLELHPDMTAEEWTSKSPKEIFEESNYISNYE